MDANGYAWLFPTRQEALDYVAEATPHAIITEVEAVRSAHEGKNYKPRVDLVDPNFIVGMGRVLAAGAEKYAAGNWRLGAAYSDRYASAQRHLLAWASGEDCDPETGENHLHHAATCLQILAYWQLSGRGTDDRS